MKLLFDENLSRKLVARLAELYPASAYVVEFDLLESSDREIGEFAKTREFVIVSTDADYCELATTMGPPPKVIWLGPGRTRQGMPNGYCGAMPSGSLNSSLIRNSAS